MKAVLWMVLIIALTLIAAQYLLEVLPPSAFRDSFLGNWLATISGAILGVPIALWLSSLQQKREGSTRKATILQLIRDELEVNRQVLTSSIQNRRESPYWVSNIGLKSDLWNALHYGGELRWIDDLDLLNLLSATYHYVTRIIHLELEYFDPSFMGKATTVKGEEIIQGRRTLAALSAICPDALELVEKAIARIDSSVRAR